MLWGWSCCPLEGGPCPEVSLGWTGARSWGEEVHVQQGRSVEGLFLSFVDVSCLYQYWKCSVEYRP